MKLGTLSPPKGAKKNTKRKGRGTGSGLGKTAGRGHKGAGQRSGNKKRAWFEGGQMPLVRRLPKRGFSNHIFKKYFQIVSLEDIANLKLDSVDTNVLYKKGLVKSQFKPIKILNSGELSKPLSITANMFSKNAREAIENAGGTVIEL